jgi:DNA primase
VSDRPYVDFNKVKELVTIPMALEKIGILDQFKERKDQWRGVCPIPTHKHNDIRANDKQFVFDNKRKGQWLWHCFGDCNEGGDVIKLVMRIREESASHVRLWFAEHFGEVLGIATPRQVDARPERNVTVEDSSVKLADGITPMKFYLNVNLDQAHDFLKRRGISIETAMRFGVGHYSKKGTMFEGYVVVPVYRWPMESEQEYPLGYVGRWPDEDYDKQNKSRYKVGFECSNSVFGLGEALEASDQEFPLIVVEGVLKALWLIDRGYTNVVSTFTSNVSDRQVDRLVKTKRNVVLAFDGDEAGQQGMRQAAAKLITECFVNVAKLPEGREVDQLTSSEVDALFGFAEP